MRDRAGWVAVGVVAGVLELVGLAGRHPTLTATLTPAVRRHRVAAAAVWAWVGWHFWERCR